MELCRLPALVEYCENDDMPEDRPNVDEGLPAPSVDNRTVLRPWAWAGQPAQTDTAPAARIISMPGRILILPS